MRMKILQVCLLSSVVLRAASFQLGTSARGLPTTRTSSSTVIKAKKKSTKGFGKVEESPSPDPEMKAIPIETKVERNVDQESAPKKNAGQKALEEMRRQRAEQRDEELRRIRELRQADEQVSSQGAAIPEKVAQRMGKRMLPFVGLPLFLGMGSFVAFWYFATYQNLEFQPALVAGTTIGILVLGLLVSLSSLPTSFAVIACFYIIEFFSLTIELSRALPTRSCQHRGTPIERAASWVQKSFPRM